MRLLGTALVMLVFGLCFCASAAAAKGHPLVFSVNAPGTKPYLYFDEKRQSYQGIVVDFFASIEGDNRFEVDYLDTSRSRYEETLLTHKADMFISAKAWLQHPDSFWTSLALAAHNSHLYATKPFAASFNLQQLSQATVCTRTNFVYPSLHGRFRNQRLLRLDSSNNSTMTAMLAKGRCDYLVMGQEDAQAEMFRPNYCHTAIYESPTVISSVDMVLVIRADKPELQRRLNTELQRFIRSGQRDQSFQKHAGSAKFPKPRCG